MEQFCACGRRAGQCDGSRAGCPVNQPGSNHLSDENIAATIAFLERVEVCDDGSFEEWQNLDPLTFAGILARQMRHLRRFSA